MDFLKIFRIYCSDKPLVFLCALLLAEVHGIFLERESRLDRKSIFLQLDNLARRRFHLGANLELVQSNLIVVIAGSKKTCWHN